MLTRWNDRNTFARMGNLQRRMNRLFEDYDVQRWPGRTTMSAWPPANLFDTGDALVLTALVPGLAEDEIELTGNQDVLTLRGERKVEAPEGYAAHRRERSAVAFSRSFTFPCKVDMEKTTAKVKDGVLTVNMSKAPEAQPHQIAVKAQ